MKEKWTGDVVGKMHVREITMQDLADEMGVTKAYVSMILNNIKYPKNARQRTEDALQSIIDRQKGGKIERTARKSN